MIDYLLSQDLVEWDHLIARYEQEIKALKVPQENTINTLYAFNYAIEELYTRAILDFNRARTNNDAIRRLLKTVLEDAYAGNNDLSRRAAGIQRARSYPAPSFYFKSNVNLFELESKFGYHFYMMEAVVKSLEAKQAAKVTNNSLLKMENNL